MNTKKIDVNIILTEIESMKRNKFMSFNRHDLNLRLQWLVLEHIGLSRRYK